VSFERAADLESLWPGEMRGISLGAVKVLLVNVEGTVLAYEDRCLHRGVQLCRGKLEGDTLTCSAHAWQYDACTGTGKNPLGVALRRFPVKVEGGQIWVDVTLAAEAPMSETLDRRDWVGPVLQAGPASTAVIAAIRESNPEAAVVDRGAYLRVLAPGSCRVTRAGIERHLGQPFRLPGDLEQVMSSFKGRLTVSEDHATWDFRTTPQAREGGGEAAREVEAE
jgi:toluene monooxygenase system ferredoxin subunit